MLPRFESLSRRLRSSSAPALAALLAGLVAVAAPGDASADLGIGPSAPFDPTIIRAVRSQEHVAAADNGTVTLFAWVDSRSGNEDIYAARVAHDGTVLDPNGIPVAVTGQGEAQPTVSWNGTNWLVAWAQDSGGGIFAARVATSGEVLDPSGIPVTMSPFYPATPCAVGLGAGHLIVWTLNDISHIVQGAIIASDGSFDVSPMTLSVGAGPNHTGPRLAVRGTTALCAFKSETTGDTGIRAFRFERSTAGPPTLNRLDPTDLAVSPGGVREGAPAVAASAGGWLIAWQDARNDATSGVDILAARVSPAGALLDASGIDVATESGNDLAPAVTHNGSQWLVAWSQDGVGQYLRAVADNGNPAAQRREVSTAPGVFGRAAFGGAAATPIVAWSDPEVGTSPPSPPQDILGRVVAANLSFGDPFPISTQTPNQTQPAMSFGANRWFVAWVDDRYGPTEGRLRYAVTPGAELEPPAPGAIAWAAERPGLDQQQPTACFDGTNFNLFWTEERGGHRRIVGARFTTGGAWIDSFTVAAEAWDHVEPTCIHAGNGRVTVAWTDTRLPTDRDIWARQVLAGALEGSELRIVDNAGVNDERPRFPARVVDPDDVSTVLVYQKRGGGDPGSIALRFVYSEPLDRSGFEYLVRHDVGHVYEAPQVAWNGWQYLVTYQELVANDGSGLYIPWGTWLNAPFNFVSYPLELGPGSYVPANPITASAGANFVTLRSRLSGNQVNLDVRRANAFPDFVDDDPLPYTSGPGFAVPGAALQGQGDHVGLLHLRQQADAEWNGLRLFGGQVQDSLEGRVVINEFLANPPGGVDEFYELFNISGQSFQLEGWYLVIDGETTLVSTCFNEGFRTGKPGGDVIQGSQCGVIFDQETRANYDFYGIPGTPDEGKLPNRGAVLELFSPGGVKVDQVGYGFKGGAPVSPGIPLDQAPAGRVDRTPLATESGGGAFRPAVGDSIELSTARLPNGNDTGDDANDFNLTSNSTPGTPNQGEAAQLGSKLFVSRAFWNPVTGPDAVELFNPSLDTFDFSGWYLGSNDGTQRIGVPGNAWSVMPSLDKRALRRGELGSFTTDLDYLTVVYLLDENFVRVEQIGWSRPDNQQPQMCLKREPDTGGFHNGWDWFTSGGEQNLFAGQLRYVECDLSNPGGTIGAGATGAALAFRGAVPNPMPAGRGALVFTVPGLPGGARAAVRLRLFDVAGRARATLVDEALAPGEHRVPLAGAAAGVYYARLEIAGRSLSQPVVVVP